MLDHIFLRPRQAVATTCSPPSRVFANERQQDRLSDQLGVEVELRFSPVESRGQALLGLKSATDALADAEE